MKTVIVAAAAVLALRALGALPAQAATPDVSLPAVSSQAPVVLPGLNYVALGDSYSAGFGLIPYSDSPAAGCYQADANYPHLVAAALGMSLDDRTCSGAETANIRNTPQPTITGKGVAPVQSDALTEATDVVTVTIGGNDLGFADVAAFCLANSATGPLLNDLFNNCKDYFVHTVTVGGTTHVIDQLADDIDNTVGPDLDATFALIKVKAPNAKVFVIGYPTLSPDRGNVPAGGCFSPAITDAPPPYPENAFPYTDTDTAYLHGTEARLNKAIQAAAKDNGATYIDTMTATAAHSACAPTADAYINGVTLLTSGEGQGTPTGIPGLTVKLGALHPNPVGVSYLADTVTAAITTTLGTTAPAPATTPPGPSSTPAPTPTETSTPVVGNAGGAPAQPASTRTLAATGTDPAPFLCAGLIALLLGGVGVRAVSHYRAPRRGSDAR